MLQASAQGSKQAAAVGKQRQKTGSGAPAAAGGKPAEGGEEGMQQRLSRLEAVILELQAQQAATSALEAAGGAQQQQQQEQQPQWLVRSLGAAWQSLGSRVGLRHEPPASATTSEPSGQSAQSSPDAADSKGASSISNVPTQRSADAPATAAHSTAAASGRGPPGNTANRLLHAMGQPMRWLRRLGEDAGS